MKAGRELDALAVEIAEKVMGLKVLSEPDEMSACIERGGDFFGDKTVCTVKAYNRHFDEFQAHRKIALVRHYPTDIAASWEVVENVINSKTGPQKTYFMIEEVGLKSETRRWAATFFGAVSYSKMAKTAPLAICLAALKAIEGTCKD